LLGRKRGSPGRWWPSRRVERGVDSHGFISGITGQFYRQFALTIAVATLISAFNSLTLSPALAALLLKPRSTKKDLIARGLDLALGWFFRLFNKGFDAATNAYASAVRACCAWRQWSRWCTRGC
jgi:multidrug efflux pump subunit AcrB